MKWREYGYNVLCTYVALGMDGNAYCTYQYDCNYNF